MAVTRRVVVTGLGSIGRRHARLLRERADVALEVVEPDAGVLELARGQLGALKTHSSFEAMLESTPDAVLVSTPTGLHADQTIRALEAGVHVFCEKPMSDSVQAAARIKQTADRSGRVLNIGFHLHFCEGLRRLKKVIDRGELGTVLYARMHVGTYATLVNSVSRYQSREEGSLMFDYSHQPDLLWWLFRAVPRTVYAAGFQGGQLEFTSRPNVVEILCEYDQPFLATIHLNYLQSPERHEYEVVGDEGWAVLDYMRSSLRVGRRRDDTIMESTFSIDKDQMVRDEHQAFFDAIAGLRAPETSADDGLVSTSICEAAVESWRTGRPVEPGGPARHSGA